MRAGRGHEHAVVGAEVVNAGHECGLVRERRLGVQHSFGGAARTRSEQHGRELLAFGPRFGDGRAERQRVEIFDDQLRPDRALRSRDFLRPELMVQW